MRSLVHASCASSPSAWALLRLLYSRCQALLGNEESVRRYQTLAGSRCIPSHMILAEILPVGTLKSVLLEESHGCKEDGCIGPGGSNAARRIRIHLGHRCRSGQ